ncbi:MAG: DUF4358 domain-containing protein [Clostridia bacterium]|nr:DUF4358 domain-containing protein [Clostridia bacterium]
MRKPVSLLLLLALLGLLLSGCAAKNPAPQTDAVPVPLSELAQTALSDRDQLVQLYRDDLTDVIGIEKSDYTESVYLGTEDLSGREVIVLRAADADAAGRIEERLGNYLLQRQKETRNYLPEAYQLLSGAKVSRSGLTVALIVGEHAEEETAAFLKGNP